MNSRRSKRGKEAAEDELALVKAAAWAWYLHGSGAEGKPVKESDPWRTKAPPRPSRYKLEAVARKDQQTDLTSPPSSSSTTSLSPVISVLMDSYEIQTISRQLNYLLEDSFRERHVYVIDNFDHLKSSSLIEIDAVKQTSKAKTGRGKGSRRNWMMHAATVCGPVAGGVEATLVKSRTKKHEYSFEKHGSLVLVD